MELQINAPMPTCATGEEFHELYVLNESFDFVLLGLYTTLPTLATLLTKTDTAILYLEGQSARRLVRYMFDRRRIDPERDAFFYYNPQHNSVCLLGMYQHLDEAELKFVDVIKTVPNARLIPNSKVDGWSLQVMQTSTTKH